MQPDGPGSMVREYVEKAEEDLRAAEALTREGSLDALVCFHSQQAVEKMLKAALLAAGLEPPRTHDLGYLLETFEEVRTVPGELSAICAVLADFAVAPRYPGWEAGIGGVDSAEALAAARSALVLLRPLVFSEDPT